MPEQAEGIKHIGIGLTLITVSDLAHASCIALESPTFRARLARRTHHLVHRKQLLHCGMYLVGALYNFCTVHAIVTVVGGQQRTPAMAAGITARR